MRRRRDGAEIVADRLSSIRRFLLDGRFLTIPGCALAAVLVAALGFSLVKATPLPPPDLALSARLKAWQDLSEQTLRDHYLIRRKP